MEEPFRPERLFSLVASKAEAAMAESAGRFSKARLDKTN
jgi:hypothetical protein